MLTTIAILTFLIGFCIYEFIIPWFVGMGGIYELSMPLLIFACLFFIASFVLTIIDLAYRIYCWKHYV